MLEEVALGGMFWSSAADDSNVSSQTAVCSSYPHGVMRHSGTPAQRVLKYIRPCCVVLVVSSGAVWSGAEMCSGPGSVMCCCAVSGEGGVKNVF